MVEEPNNQETYTTEQVEIYNNDPEKHVELIEEIGSINGVDELEKYFTGLAFDMFQDSKNCFLYGGVGYMSGINDYTEQHSEEHKEMIRKRLGWLSRFAYTPKEIKEETKNFFENYKKTEDTLNNTNTWIDISNKWVNLVKEFVRGSRRKEENKEAMDYYNKHNSKLLKENEGRGLKVTKKE
jgi:hypothetical protein